MSALFKRHTLLALAVLPALLSGACSSSDTATPSASPSTATTTEVPTASATSATGTSEAIITVKDFSFQPAALTNKKGTSVTWSNKDTVKHTVYPDSGTAFDGNLDPGGSYTFTFNEAGTFGYHCQIHPQMKGTITVQ